MKKKSSSDTTDAVGAPYGCSDYREEMILLSLRQRLQQVDLTEEERRKLLKEIERLEKDIGF